MVKTFFVAIFFVASTTLFAQNVGINLTGATPSGNAILDLNTGNTTYKLGLILPHAELGSSLSTFGMTGAATTSDTGLLVYNMNFTGQPIGLYYWNGSIWVSIPSSGTVWQTSGNAGTTASSAIIGSPVNNNFIGTTDAKDFVFATDNYERMRITSGGNVGIGTSAPAANAALTIKDGHLTSQITSPPTITSATTYLLAAQFISNATDMAGHLSITSTAAAGSVTITFNKAYNVAPIVMLTPTNASAAAEWVNGQVYVTSTTTTFTINYNASPTAATMTYYYFVIETQ